MEKPLFSTMTPDSKSEDQTDQEAAEDLEDRAWTALAREGAEEHKA
jgi:hypothetical protein